MGVRKIAISVPDDVLKTVDRLAKNSGISRSGFISRVLTEVSHARGQAEITVRLNRLFEDPGVSAEQSSSSEFFLRAAESGKSGGSGSEW